MPTLPIPDVLPGADGTRFQTHFSAWLRGLTPDQQQRFLERLEFLQLLSPKTGYRLQQRCACLKRNVLYGLIGNSAYGRSLLARKRYLTRIRNGHPLKPHSRRLAQWRAEEEERQRMIAERLVG